MAEAELSEYVSTEDPMFEREFRQGAYSLMVKRRGDAVFVESLKSEGDADPKDLFRLYKRLHQWKMLTGLTLSIIVETPNTKMMKFMENWRDAERIATVYNL